MFATNSYIALNDEEVENLLYRGENPYKPNGLYLVQCHPILEGSSSEGKHHVCFFEDISIRNVVVSLREQFPNINNTSHERFFGYDGGDGINGLVTYWVPTDDRKNQPSGRYTSFFDGQTKTRRNLGMFIDYMNYLLENKVPESEWMAEKNKLKYLLTLEKVCLYCIDKDYDYDPLIDDPDVLEEAVKLLNKFDPEMKV